jgi:hypothetical protein
VVLGTLGPRVLQRVCEDVQQQLQQEFEQPRQQIRRYRRLAWSGKHRYYFQVSYLAEALLMGWVRTQQLLHAARQPVVAPLQRLVLHSVYATGQQQQQQQHLSSSVSVSSRLASTLKWCMRQPDQLLVKGGDTAVNQQLEGLVQAAECAAAEGDAGHAHRLLGEFWCLYLQQHNRGGACNDACCRGSRSAVHTTGTPTAIGRLGPAPGAK